MPILSQRVVRDVSRTYWRAYRLRPAVLDLAGRVVGAAGGLAGAPELRRKRDYALQQSLAMGRPYVFSPMPGLTAWVVGIEDRRMIHGGLLGGGVRVRESREEEKDLLAYLLARGDESGRARRAVRRLPLWPESRVEEAARALEETFYAVSGWTPALLRENRLEVQRQEQLNQAIEDQRRNGRDVLYAFEKERTLLANIRAGERNEARRILNEMLATIYLSSPGLVVLRARAVELMTCLTRAAIEDNPLLEPLIERNHAWTERLITAPSFEVLSGVLMESLDDFIDGIYLHGANRSNTKVRKALDFIGSHYSRPITLGMVAQDLGLSPCRVSHLVKDFTGRTVLQILRQVRIRHAQRLLERSDKSCTDIAYEVGFGDQSYFIRQFKRLTGKTPGQYRRG